MKSESNDIYWSGYSKAPVFENFSNWYNAQLLRNDRRIWIVRQICEPYLPVGYLYITYENNVLKLSHGVVSSFRGLGVSLKIINFATNFCLTNYSKCELEAWIVENNLASIKSFLKNNFIETGMLKKKFYESFNSIVILINYRFRKL